MKQSPFTLIILLIIFIIIIGGVRDDNTNKISKGSIVISPDNQVSFFQGKLKGSNTVEKQSEKNFELVCPNLYKFKDACNVYLLKSGSAGILIETGSGKVLDYLEEVGVEKIEWVLHTHSHRDQCFGDLLLKKHGSKIAIGKQEADALQPAGINPPFTPPGNTGKYSKLPSLPGRMEPFQKPGVDRELTNGEVIEWKQYKIRVINTPGHTKGSVSFLVEVDGKKVCFCGDLMVSGGRVRDLYSMQWIYLQNPGIDSSLVSLQKIRELDPGIILPSHGEQIENTAEEISTLSLRLQRVQKCLGRGSAGRWNWSGFVQISPHVIQDCGTTSQIIISDRGEALLFDCGEGFTPERLEEAKRKFGIKRIDVIIPSHWHGDHINGIPELAKAEGSEIWIWEGLTEHLEHPERFITTCWYRVRIKADRILLEGEEFQWGDYHFKVYHHPVHMEEQIGLYAKVDELDFYFLADGTGNRRDGKVGCALHCYNGITLKSGLKKTAQSFYEANPYICVPAHSNCFATNSNTRNEFLKWALETTDAITALLPPPHPEIGYDPYWAAFYPARVNARPGEEVQITLRLKNHANRSVTGKIWTRSYGDLVVEQESVEYVLEPGEQQEFPLNVKVEKTASTGVHIVTADIEYDGFMFAEFTHGYVQINE